MNSTTSFTFLATLFVLLLISASIIFRSFLIRRRFRQQVEGALAQGVYFNVSPSGLGFATHYIGEKPKVHEAWIKQSVSREKTQWQNIMVFSELLEFISLRSSPKFFPIASHHYFDAQHRTRQGVPITS